jgi:D-glycero-D-manno-heptose 1,7-bisphosphate phosphatase
LPQAAGWAVPRSHIALAGVPALGDALRDLLAAAEVGARPMLVRTGKGVRTLASGNVPDGTPVYADLAEAVSALTGGVES